MRSDVNDADLAPSELLLESRNDEVAVHQALTAELLGDRRRQEIPDPGAGRGGRFIDGPVRTDPELGVTRQEPPLTPGPEKCAHRGEIAIVAAKASFYRKGRIFQRFSAARVDVGNGAPGGAREIG